MKIETFTHEENWKVCEELKEKGYCKIADCMWSKTFRKDNETIIVELKY